MNNILKTSTVLLTLSLALSTGAAYAQTGSTSVTKNATEISASVNQKTFKIEVNGSTLKETGFQTTNGKEPMVPLRSVAEALGFELTWNAPTKSVDLLKGIRFTTLTAGQDIYSINKMITKLGTAPELVGSTMYVPASFVSEVIQQNMTVKGDSIVISDANQEEHMTKTGVITSVYSEGKHQSVQIQGVGPDGVVLNVGEDTVFEMADGTKLTLDDLHIGMTVKAEHSMVMTMSLPPQTPTYKITVLDKEKQSNLLGTSGTIEEVQKDDEGNIRIAVKGSGLSEASQSEVILNISADTVLMNQNGEAVQSSELVKGAKVIGFYGPMLTKSLPPIGTAVKVVVSADQQ